MSDPSKNNSLRNFPADMLVVSGLPFLGVAMIVGMLYEHAHIILILSLIVACVGACLLFWAKLPLYRAGIYTSFGPAAIPATHRRFYYWGLGLALGGCGLAAVLLPLARVFE
jgi:amino acid transporter